METLLELCARPAATLRSGPFALDSILLRRKRDEPRRAPEPV